MKPKLVDKDELASILNIKRRRLSIIENENLLEQKLNNSGYTLISKSKNGRKDVYKIALIDKNQKEFFNMCEKEFKTNKANEFRTYFIKREEYEGYPISKKDLAEEIDISIYQLNKWDSIMLEKEIISEYGWAYFKIIEGEDGNRYAIQCSLSEYNAFWKVKLSMKFYKDIRILFEKGDIGLEELQRRSVELSKLENKYEGFFYYKIKLYNFNKDNPIYLDVKTLVFQRNS